MASQTINVDTLLSSQETDTQASLTSKTYQVIASALLKSFFSPFPAPPTLSDNRGTICTVPFLERPICLACRTSRPLGDSEKSRQPKVSESNPCVNRLIYQRDRAASLRCYRWSYMTDALQDASAPYAASILPPTAPHSSAAYRPARAGPRRPPRPARSDPGQSS